MLLGDFVSAEDGTGIVHTAIAFGEDDFRLGEQYGLNVVNPVQLDGTYDERIGPYAGRFVKDADDDLVEDLARARPACCAPRSTSTPTRTAGAAATPLLYYAKPRWYIAHHEAARPSCWPPTRRVDWHPEHIKHGRFGDWLANNVDWALSRERYWGTPLPVWRCEEGHTHVHRVLRRARGAAAACALEDPHRPFVDEVGFPCPQCDEARCSACPRSSTCGSTRAACRSRRSTSRSRTRSASRRTSPRTSSARRSTRRAAGSTRCSRSRRCCSAARPTSTWSASACSLDERGRRRCRSRKGNIVVPWDVIDRYGADAFRWYFFTSKQPWDGYRFSMKTIGESVRLFLRQLWNVHAFLRSLRARWAADGRRDRPRPLVLSRLAATVGRGDRAPGGLRRDVRRPRDRGLRRRPLELVRAPLAPAVLGRRPERRSRRCASACSTVAQLLAPFTPFVADEICENLGGEGDRCTCATGRRPASATLELEAAMAVARETVRLGLAARGQAKVKVRQPLHEAVVVAVGRRARGDRAARRTSSRRSSTSSACASWRRPTSSAPTRSSPTTARSARASASRCRRWRRRSRRSTRRTSLRRRATASRVRHQRRRRRARAGARRPAARRCSRSRATSSSARDRTRSRWS